MSVLYTENNKNDGQSNMLLQQNKKSGINSFNNNFRKQFPDKISFILT